MVIFDILFLIQVGVIIFSVLIYPPVVNYLAKGKSLAYKQYTNSTIPKVTLLIPTYNEEEYISQKINNVKLLNYPKNKLNVIIVDNGSTDKTVEIAKSLGIKVLKSKRGKINAIINGVKESKDELIAITDADVSLGKNSLKSAVGLINDEIVAVTGFTVCKSKEPFLLRGKIKYTYTDYHLRYLEGIISSSCSLDGKFLLVKKCILKELKEDAYTDDYELTFIILRKGLRSVIDKNAKVYEPSPASIKEELSQIERRAEIGGILTSLKNISVLFNSKYGFYGLFIFPFRRFFPFLFPFFSIYIIWYLIYKISYLSFILFGTIVLILMFTKNSYVIIQLIGVFKAWLAIFLGKGKVHSGIWKKIKLIE